MTAHHQTLLAKLAPKFGPQTENLAVDALGHILSGSKAARRALSKMIAAGGADVGEIAQVRTQATGTEGERPDLAGVDRNNLERVLIEAKFWAGLTDNQPMAYLKRLPANTPSALLFVAPAARLTTLWNELRRIVAKSPSGITLARLVETAELRRATAGGRRRLLLTSWQAMLDRMATEAADAADSDTEKDIEQLRGLAAQQDDVAFLPLRREELGPEFPPPHARPAASHRRRHRVCDRCRVRQRAGPPGHTAGVGLRTIREACHYYPLVWNQLPRLGRAPGNSAVALVSGTRLAGKDAARARTAPAKRPT